MTDDDTIRALAGELSLAETRLDAVAGLCDRAEAEGLGAGWLIRNLRDVTGRQHAR